MLDIGKLMKYPTQTDISSCDLSVEELDKIMETFTKKINGRFKRET